MSIIRWEKTPDYFYSKKIRVFFEGCYRWNFFGTNASFPLYSLQKLSGGALQYLNPSGTIVSKNGLNIASQDFNVTESFKTLNWFGGRSSYIYDTSTLDTDFTIRFSLCCRFNSLADGNKNLHSYLATRVNLQQGFSGSPVARAVPRIYLVPKYAQILPLKIFGYTIAKLPAKYRVSSKASSSLSAVVPCGNSKGCTGVNLFSLNNDGVMSWTPFAAGAYAFQAQYVEVLNTQENYTSIDLLFDVQNYTCTNFHACKKGTNNVPFITANNEYKFKPGIATTYEISVTDLDSDPNVSTTAIYLPDGADLTHTSTVGVKHNYILRWNPNVDQTISISCIISYDSAFVVALGNNCFYMNVEILEYIFINGIVRDFEDTHIDFKLTTSSTKEQRGTTLENWVLDDLVDNKPVFKSTVTGTGAPKKFAEWFNDVANVNASIINTITLSDKKELSNRSLPVFSLRTDNFFPIDGKLFAASRVGRNYLFTYELHTYFTYTGDAVETYSFKSNCDMWVFVENKLAKSPTLPQNLHGHGTTSSSIAATSFVLDMGKIASTYSPALVPESSYKIDIFFAQRMDKVDPIFEIEMSKSTHCNALNMIRDDVSASATAIDLSLNTDTDIVLNGVAEVTGTGAQILGASNYQSHESGSIWFGELTTKTGKQKVMSGFRTKFSFQTDKDYAKENGRRTIKVSNKNYDVDVQQGPDGFAFVIQNHDIQSRGPGGSNLGYASLRNSVAIEFDFLSNARNDPKYQHISVHTAYGNANSAEEDPAYYPSGSTYTKNDPLLPFYMNNGSRHDVRIDFSPSEDVTWMTIYLNENIRPVFEAQLDTSVLRTMWRDGAYVGFTAGNGGHTTHTALNTLDVTIPGGILLRSWNMMVVPPLAETSTYETGKPTNVVAGSRVLLPIQLRDYCGNPIFLTGVSQRLRGHFTSLETDTRITVDAVDILDGKYTFEAVLTAAGLYEFHAEYQTVTDGPFEAIDKGTILAFSVLPAQLSLQYSQVYHGILPEGINTMGSESGYFCLGIQEDGKPYTKQGQGQDDVIDFRLIASHLIQNPTTVDVFIPYFDSIAINDYIACVKKGSVGQLSPGDVSRMKDRLFMSSTPINNTNAIISIVQKTAANMTVKLAFMENKSRIVYFKHTVIPPVGSIVENFTIYASSAIDIPNVPVKSYLQIAQRPHRTYINAENSVTIAAFDIYKNAKHDVAGEDFLLIVNPRTNVEIAECASYQGHLSRCGWMSPQTGVYTGSVSTTDGPVDQDISINILSGPASHIYSSSMSIPQTIIAGQSSVLTIRLRDIDNMAIDVQNPDDVVTVILQTTDVNISPPNQYLFEYVFEANSAIRTYNLPASLAPTKAGIYDLIITINGEELVATENVVVHVVPSDVDPSKSIVYGDVYDDINTPVPHTAMVGIHEKIYIQTYDKYNNPRTSQETSGNVKIQLVTQNDAIILYENNGRYSIDFFVTNTDDITIVMEYQSLLISPAQRIPVRTISGVNSDGTFTLTDVKAGPLDVASKFLETTQLPTATNGKYSKVAGVESVFLVKMYDVYQNLRVKEDDIVENVVVSYNSVTYQNKLAFGTYSWDKCVGGMCELRLKATTTSGLLPNKNYYKLTVQIKRTGEHLIVVPIPDTNVGGDSTSILIDVTPDVYTASKTIFGKVIDIIREETIASFPVTLHDKYGNRISTCPPVPVVATMEYLGLASTKPSIPSIECSSCLPTDPGVYYCRFEVPVSITPSEANPLADSFKITVLTDSVNNGDMVFRSAAADDVFYAVVDITNPQPRLGNNLQFTIRNTMSTRQGDRPTQIPIIAKLVLLSSNTANPADEPNASFSIVTGKVSPTNSALFTFDYTFTTTGDFILIPMRSGGLESDYETLGSVPQRRGVFHPGLFYPPSSPITTSTSSSTTTNTIVAGNEVVWTVVPHDILGNRFRICQAEIKLQLFVFDLDSNNSTLEPVSNASCQCKIDTSITPPSPLVECKFSIEKATRYDIYILNDPQLPAPTNPADIPEDIIVSASSLFFTVLNNIPSQVHSILADDSTGKGFLSYDFETPATSRVLKLNTPFSVFILLFDQYKNPCKTGDFTTSIGIKRDNVNILGSNPSEVAVLRNGNQHVYRAMFTFTKFAPQTSTQVVFSVNSEVIPTKYDIIGGFRALIPSGPAASVLLTSASNTYTVDEDIQFTLTLSDALNQRWVQNVLNPSLDSRSIIFNLYRDNSSSSSSSIPIQGIITKLNDVGVFTINIAASQLRFADKYTVEVIVDGKNLSSVVPSSYSSINIIAGKPNLSSMQVVQNSKILVTGSAERSNTFSFTLFDTKGNPILSQVPEVFKFVPIMGTLSCASPDLTWSVVNPASSADLRLESTYDSSRKTIVYTVYISPRRVSFFTVVIFGADKNNFAPFIPFADIPENYAVDCLVSSTLTYEIIPGPASAANSIVQITAPNPIPGSAFPDYTLISGTEVTMTVQLKDTSDQNTITNNYCVQMGHIGGPTGNSADATVLEHYPCAPNCNTLPLRDSIIISPRFDFKQRLQGLFEFKFTLTGVRFDKNFNEPLPYDVVFYLLEYPSDPFSTNTNINNVPLICPEGLQRSTQISGQQSHRMKLKILPSAPKTLRPGKIIQQSLYDDDEDSLPTTFIAGQDLLLVLISADGYGNHVIISTDPDSKSYSTAVEIKRLSSVAIFDQYTDEKPPVTPIYMPMYIFFADMSTNDDGSFIAKFQPAWEGNYLLTSMLFSSDNNIVDFVLTIPFTVQHIKCELRGYQFLTCPDGSCVDDLSKCAVSPVCTEEGKLIQCFDKTCVSTPSECPCPIDTERCETTSQCVSTISSNTETCPAASTCSNVTCPNDQTQCREDEQSCPSIGVCPLAYILCPNGYSCASEVAKCPPLRQPSDCPADSQYVCYDGSCANDISNCPTKITCPLDTVLCLTDNTCRESIQDCPMYYEECSGNMIRCITGSCASSYDACPSSISCPIGYTKCENGACASSITQCHKTIQCNISEVRCYDGSCAQNPILCPSQIVCPIDLPVMCSDHNCVSSISECNDISTTTCPQGSQVCPDGTCILGTRCPVVKRCPVERPILCSNNTCVSDRVDCNPPLECTSSLPIRCSNGDCRANILDCPSIISCPISRPLRCNDGSCAQALNTCTEIIAGIDTGLPSDNKDKEKDKDRFICPYPKITCPGGECADTRLLCPTHVTCPLGSVKCNDGRCAAETDCPSSNDGNYCPDDKLLCPISTAGISCASKINDCPTNIICPENKPVRCIDSTCAVSITACPPLADAGEEGSSSETKKPCSDGSWTVGTCSTTVTCTAEIPYKCYDQSCRKSPFDCPIPPICPSATPYLCSTGSCAKFLWDCTVPVDGICEEANKPIKCPIVDGNMKCVDDTIHCDKRLDDDTTGNRTYCPGNNVYCRDGTCKESAAACPLPTCPPSLPYLCQDGMCAKNNLQCNHENGCPFNKPVKCADGECKFRFAECSHFACPSTQDKISSPSCADGTCRDECSDIGANGCRVGYFRCYDGSCVSSYTQCISSTDSMNVCPGNRPVRCESGLCVTTKSNCPILDPSHTICPNPLKPIFCADGSCQENSILCRTIKPCDRENTVRCDDGVCRDVGRFDDKEQCPKLQSCPPQLPFRCPSGPCSTNSQTCPDVDGCPMINSVAQFRCPSGLCVQDLDLCKTVSSSNGCPSDAVKCWDGSCQDSSNKCPKNNGCSSATPYRCTSGKCVDSLDNCTADDKLGCSAPNVKCADGSCEASISMCKTTLGCPVTKPIRCADGNCAKYPATFREPIFGLPSDQLELTCTPTIICPSANHVRCANGECAASYDLCPSFNNICTTIEKPYLCSDNKTCVEDLQKCVSSTCPPTSPVLCPNGGCSLTALDCNNRYNPQTSTIAGSSVVSRCGSKKITCFDGSCADRYQECVNHASDIENDAIIQNPLDYIRCGTICSDGSCLPVNSASLCPPIPSCPANHYRCESGACVEDTNACDTLSPCKSYQIRGVDGICRTIGTNPPFDGCDWDTAHRYMCENRECAENAAGCEAASRLDADVWANTLFKDSKNMKKAIDDAKAAAAANDSNNTSNNISQVPSSTVTPPSAFESVTSMTEKIQLLNDDGTSFACQEDCYNQIKVNRTSVNYSASEAVTIPLAPISTRLQVTIPTGLYVDSKGGSAFYFSSVSESIVVNATNRVHYSRVNGAENYPSTLTYAQTVLSPIVSCYTEKGIEQPFAVPVELSSNIDMHHNLKYNDVCLARLRRFNNLESPYTTWECVYSTAERLQEKYSVKKDPTILPGYVTSSIYYCNDPDVLSEPAIYAFILNPLTSRQVYKQSLDTFFRDNMIWILLGACGGLLVIAMILFTFQRLARFKGKTVQIKDDVKRMENEVDEMEQFGGKAGTKDEEVMLQHNPLAVQLADVQKLTDDNQLKLQQEKIAQQQAESNERTNIIVQLEEETKRGLEMLDNMKKKLHDTTQAKRVNGDDMTVQISSTESATSRGPTANTNDTSQSQVSSPKALDTQPQQTMKKRHDM